MNEHFSTVLQEAPAAHQDALRHALAPVDTASVQSWIGSGALHEWVTQGTRLLGNSPKVSAAQLADFFTVTPHALGVLSSGEIGEWLRMGLDIAPADAAVFARLPDYIEELSGAERLNVYRLVRSSAYRSPQAAAELYRALPRILLLLAPVLRPPLFRCLQAAAIFDPEPLPTVLPFLAPTLNSLPPERQISLLERIAQMAQPFPAGVARLFRSLNRAYDLVGEEGVQSWMTAGEAIARKSPQAGEAFFALESRTSLLLLYGASPAVALQDIHGVLLKYLHMLSGDALGIGESPFLSVPPPLAEDPEDALPLPVQIEVFPTYEENLRLYRVLAAHQAGRWSFGTYACSVPRFWSSLPESVHKLAEKNGAPPNDLASYFQLFPQPEQLEALFLLIEGRRVTGRLAQAYHGLRDDLAWAASLTELLPPVLATTLPRIPQALWRELGTEATVYDALVLATELHTWLVAPELARAARSTALEDWERPDEFAPEPANAQRERGSYSEHANSQISAEQQEILQKIAKALRAHGKKKKDPLRQEPENGLLTFNIEAEDEDDTLKTKRKAGERRLQTATGIQYVYDEWDFLIEDYRPQWSQVREVPIIGDNGAFFSRTLASYSERTEDIKREFQRLRPRLYRQVKGLEDGETIDLDAAVAARVDLRSGVPPSPKLYIARQPLERDIAALFLIDLSASTEAALPGREGTRVIDVMKESLVLLSTALDMIGDSYAIYGFSSGGRRNVELFPVKTFTERLSTEARGRIGGLTPQRSTRMGAAVRHGIRKLRDLSHRAKLLVLLSDGHPEDADYGPSAHAPMYGVRDTMMALREAERRGIMSFCLTIDKAGRDYLREMFAPSRYMIIDDPAALPSELPKIYQRHIRLQRE